VERNDEAGLCVSDSLTPSENDGLVGTILVWVWAVK